MQETEAEPKRCRACGEPLDNAPERVKLADPFPGSKIPIHLCKAVARDKVYLMSDEVLTEGWAPAARR